MPDLAARCRAAHTLLVMARGSAESAALVSAALALLDSALALIDTPPDAGDGPDINPS